MTICWTLLQNSGLQFGGIRRCAYVGLVTWNRKGVQSGSRLSPLMQGDSLD